MNIDQLVKNGLGQTTALGIGGDPIIGTDMIAALELFENDPETEGIVMIGEIGGQMENEAAQWAENVTKPIVGFIVGKLHLRTSNGSCWNSNVWWG